VGGFPKDTQEFYHSVFPPPVAEAEGHPEAIVVKDPDPFPDRDHPIGVNLAENGFAGQHKRF
jgi:hypothetical protein